MSVVSIGLEDDVVDAIRKKTGVKVTAYPNVPRLYVKDQQVFVESDRAMGLFLEADVVLWYGYFQNAHEQRMALALANAVTYPDMNAALPWDDKMNAVRLIKDWHHDLSYFPSNISPAEILGSDADLVFKWGNDHCGDGKAREAQSVPSRRPVLAEPFHVGKSYRVLRVGPHTSLLKYESQDWRKNVGGTISLVEGDEPAFYEMRTITQELMSAHDLEVAGVDFIVTDDGDIEILEVNTYPSLEEDSLAKEAFINRACEAISFALPTVD